MNQNPTSETVVREPYSKRDRAIFDIGFRACAGYGDNRHHHCGEQADRVFAAAMNEIDALARQPEQGEGHDGVGLIATERLRQVMQEGCPECGCDVRDTAYHHYLVCSSGHLLSDAPNKRWKGVRVIKAVRRKGRYDFVRINIEGRRRTIDLHAIVASAFLPPKPSTAHQVRHKDGNQHNNHASNLLWGLPVENASDKKRHGTDPVGSRNPKAILTECQVAEIKRRLADGESPTDIAPLYRVHRATIYDIRHGRHWSHVRSDK